MQGEVSYREPDDHSSSVSDLESGIGANTSATTPANTTAKKAMLFTSVLLFIAACVMLVQLGNDRPLPRYDSGSPVAAHGINDNEIPNEPKQGRLEIGSFLSNAPNGGLGRYEYENLGNDEIADESEDVERVEMWTTTTEAMEAMEATTLINSRALEGNESSLSTPDNMEYPTSPRLSNSLNGDKVNEEMQSTTMFLPVLNSTSANSTMNGTLMEDSTNNPIMTTLETKKPMNVKTTTPIVAQSSAVKYSNRPVATTQPYHHYTFPLPPRPSSRQPRLQRPKNYYDYYLQKGHFPLCAAVLAFFHSFCDGFKHGFNYGFK